jgi:YVTN family beta-propeller protein
MSSRLLLPLLLLAGCQLPGAPGRMLPPLAAGEGDVYLYLDPLPPTAGGLSVAVASIAAIPVQGAPIPLEVLAPELSASASWQRLLAFGRLPSGDYQGLLVTVRRATVNSSEGVSDLLVGAEPTRVEVALTASRGRATVLALSLDLGRAVGPSFRFTPAFTVSAPSTAMVPLNGLCSNSGAASLTVFDKHAHRVVGAFPVGREPRGVALDAGRNRGYVALSGDDQVEVLDLITGTPLGMATLRNGDRPRELALTPDGRTLLVVNEGSNSLSFVDAGAAVENERLPTGLEPRALLLDRSGRRAYVLNRRANSMTVVDVPNRAVVATLATDADPVRVQLNRAGDRLYLLSAGSPYLTVLSLPGLAPLKRVFVGMGASALKVDPRTDLVYVATQSRVQVFDAFALMPIASIELPGPATWLALDEVENTLLALLPDERTVAFVDLTTRRVTGRAEVGFAPYQPAVVGER